MEALFGLSTFAACENGSSAETDMAYAAIEQTCSRFSSEKPGPGRDDLNEIGETTSRTAVWNKDGCKRNLSDGLVSKRGAAEVENG